MHNFGDATYLNRNEFLSALDTHFKAAGVAVTSPQKKALWQALGKHDPAAEIATDRKGNPEPDPTRRETEMIPFGWGGHDKVHEARDETIAAYMGAEVWPHAPGAWVDHSKTKVGYEIPFTRHFYKYVPPRPLAEIDLDLEKSVSLIMEMLREVEA